MKKCESVIVIGAGGHGRVVAEIVEARGDMVVGFLDDDMSKNDVIGTISDCEKYRDKSFVIGIGNNDIRKAIAEKYYNLRWYTAIHPISYISKSVVLGEGTVVMPNAVINTDSTIGKHCIINSMAIVEHNNLIGDFVHISPGAVLSGNVSVGNNSHIGSGAVVRNNINVTENVLIGCGGCVVKDIITPGVYVGIPASKMN